MLLGSFAWSFVSVSLGPAIATSMLSWTSAAMRLAVMSLACVPLVDLRDGALARRLRMR